MGFVCFNEKTDESKPHRRYQTIKTKNKSFLEVF